MLLNTVTRYDTFWTAKNATNEYKLKEEFNPNQE